MTAKEYLGQAYRIDQRINSKMEQIASLNLLAQKATTVSTICPVTQHAIFTAWRTS